MTNLRYNQELREDYERMQRYREQGKAFILSGFGLIFFALLCHFVVDLFGTLNKSQWELLWGIIASSLLLFLASWWRYRKARLINETLPRILYH
jgi:hypothetical protein